MTSEVNKEVDWRGHGAIVFVEGYDVAVATLYYEELAREYSDQADEQTNLQFWSGYYNLKD